MDTYNTHNMYFMSLKKKKPQSLLTLDWIKKMCYIHTVECFSAMKKNEMMPFAATRMDLESVTLSESGRQRRRSIDNISYMPGVYKEEIQMNSLTKQRDS